MVLPLIAVMVAQAILFYGATLWGGAIPKINDNAYSMLHQQVSERKSYIENEMLRRWGNLEDSVNVINSQMNQRLESYNSTLELLRDDVVCHQLLNKAADEVIQMLRKSAVTGAFFVLDSPRQTQTGISYPGVYIRNPDPTTAARDNTDLVVFRGPSSIYRSTHITTDIRWKPMFTLDENSCFFHRPLQACRANPEYPTESLGYWCAKPETGKEETITYSLPLVDKNGVAYGVLGVEISQEYLQKLLPYRELAESGDSIYSVGVSRDGGKTFNCPIVSSSHMTADLFKDYHLTMESRDDYIGLNNILDVRGEGMLAQVEYLSNYNQDSPYADDKWALIGIVSEGDLLSFSDSVVRVAVFSAICCVVTGILLAMTILQTLTRPINTLVTQLRTGNPTQPLRLDKVGLSEIDELASAIEEMSNRVAESSSMLSRIIEMSGMSIGAFDIDIANRRAVCTDKVVNLIGLPDEMYRAEISVDELKRLFELVDIEVEEQQSNCWLLRILNDKKSISWVRVKTMRTDKRCIGVIIDVTEEILSKRRIEYERDYDVLTNLFNRQAFLQSVGKLFANPEQVKTAAMIMLDLDNLKYINDSYGHDCGDCYIQAAASALKRQPIQDMLVARMSGDEFFVFIYGRDNREQIQQIIHRLQREISLTYYTPPGAEPIKIRCSGGVAWYPDDSTALDQLTRYADFAMYTAKNTKKGDFCEYDSNIYQQNSFLLHSREELNKLIDGRLVTYRFQPIVDAHTGNIFAFEALMRSTLSTLRSPLEVLSLARAQSKLYEIERVTWFTVLEQAASNERFVNGSFKLFINSVSNQMLTEDDIENLHKGYGRLMKRVVLEVTEEEKFTEDLTRKKQNMMYNWGGQIALDDFGTGYNGDMALLLLSPEYVKIDMSIVRNIDSDYSRQGIFRNLVSYSHERGIKVIAEGVESYAEMSTLIQLGVDYLQGYFIGMPGEITSSLPADLTEQICAQNRANETQSQAEESSGEEPAELSAGDEKSAGAAN